MKELFINSVYSTSTSYRSKYLL